MPDSRLGILSDSFKRQNIWKVGMYMMYIRRGSCHYIVDLRTLREWHRLQIDLWQWQHRYYSLVVRRGIKLCFTLWL